MTRADWFDQVSDNISYLDPDGLSDEEHTRRMSGRFIGLMLRNIDSGSSEGFDIEDIKHVANSTIPADMVIKCMEVLVSLGWLADDGHHHYRMTVPPGRRTAKRPEPRMPAIATVLTRRCALYRWRDEQYNLLYVGITYDVDRRQKKHASNSPWWVFTRRLEVEWLPNRLVAEELERKAIRREHPIFNRQHNDTPAARQRIAEYLQGHKRMDLFYDAMTAR